VTGRIGISKPVDGDERVYPVIVTASGEEIHAGWPDLNKALEVNTRWQGTSSVSGRRREILVRQVVSRFDPMREYQVELITGLHDGSDQIFNEVLRVSDNGDVVFDSSVCKVHQVGMERRMEDTCSACDYPESFFPLQKEMFPNDGNIYLGCGWGGSLIWKCTECDRSYQRWAERHGVRDAR